MSRLRRVAKAVLFAALHVLAFVVAPNVALSLVPRKILEMIPMMGVDVRGFLMTFAWIGLTLAALSFVRNMTDSWAYPNVLAVVASALVWLYLELLLFGLGDPSSLGVTSRSIRAGPPEGPLTITLSLDFGFIITVIALATCLTIMGDLLRFYYSRRERLAAVG